MALQRRFVLAAALVTLLIVIGNLVRPWLLRFGPLYDPRGDGALISIGIMGITWCSRTCYSRLRQHRNNREDDAVPELSAQAGIHVPEIFLLIYLVGLWLVMYRARIRTPTIFGDDWAYIRISSSWHSTLQHLFTPFAEHYCVITRLFTWVLCALFSESELPRAMALSGMGLFALALSLLYWFVRRAFNSPAAGLLAVSVMALTTVHRDVITWYSASQWCWTLVMLLGSLLILQGHKEQAGGWRLVAVALIAAVAPLNYAIGYLVGPLSSLFLACRRRPSQPPEPWSVCAVPLLATVPILVLSFTPRLVQVLFQLSQSGRVATEGIAPIQGIVYGVRSSVDLLLLRNCGIEQIIDRPRLLYAFPFLLGAFVVQELVRRTSRPCIGILGFTLVVLPYGITFPFRAWVKYEQFIQWTWYQLFPQLGIALLAATLAALCASRFFLTPRLTWGQVAFLVVWGLTLFEVHQIGW